MKACHLLLFIFLGSGLLSGCAYLEGRKDQQTVPPAHVNGKVIQMQGPPLRPSYNTTPNPSETASKMLTPIVQ
jgi:hypothetical protein